MENVLRALPSKAVKEITSENFVSGIPDAVYSSTVDLKRLVDLEPLGQVIDHAMKEFGHRNIESDAWLAPRVHATLRLQRLEAADRRIWDYLSIIAFPDYVKWRWLKNGKINLDRVAGPDHRHALARLWWSAELTRNGPDYGPTVKVFGLQTAVQFILELKAFCNRPAALGFVEFLSTAKNGGWVGDEEVKKYANALNFALSTTVLDAFAPDDGPHMEALNRWIKEEPDGLLMLKGLPVGPDESSVPPASVQSLVDLLFRLKSEMPSTDVGGEGQPQDEMRTAKA
jgi:hypothetical protein